MLLTILISVHLGALQAIDLGEIAADAILTMPVTSFTPISIERMRAEIDRRLADVS